MRKKRLLWQLYPSYLLIILIALFAVTLYASNLVRQFYLENKISDLEARARLIENQISQNLNPLNSNRINSLCKLLGEKTASRYTVILPDGKVVGDTEEDPSIMDNHLNRPEIEQASEGKPGSSTRYSTTVKKNMLYVALPLLKNKKILGYVRVSVPLTFISQTIKSIQKRIALAGIIIALFAAVISFITSRRISRPLEEMQKGVEKFAKGDLSYRLPSPQSEEMTRLAEALNQMASQLEEKVNTVIRQKNEQEAVFQSMVEGVIAVDKEERLISINKAAAELFGLDTSQVQSRSIQEIIRNSELQRFITKTLLSLEPVESEITHWDKKEHFLQVHGTVLKDEEEQTIGALIVLNDITRLHKLENVRRDFVANVSHEIRTPLTSIKGFIETLLDGAVSDPERANHFLNIISKQTKRLEAIIEDLLSLARLEKEEEADKVVLKESPLREILESALQVCSSKASEKKIYVKLHCEEGIKAKINPQLLEQAIVNLIDNAIKQSEPEKEIDITTEKTDDKVIISVKDHGCGIDKEHLPRIFERFYRVDQARSRDLGGTGLGLAIVKHIVQIHEGNVSVESSPGKGSVFSISLNT